MHSTFYRRCFQIVTAAILGYALYRIIEPLRGILGWAAVLAFILHPLHERLARRLKGATPCPPASSPASRRSLVLAPLSVLGSCSPARWRASSSTCARTPSSPTRSWSTGSPVIPLVGGARSPGCARTPQSAPRRCRAGSPRACSRCSRVAAAIGGNVALGRVRHAGRLLLMMLFMLFFFLQDGRAMLEHSRASSRWSAARRAQLLKYLGDVTRAVVFGSAATALIQGVFVGIGFALVGLPSPVVFGVLASDRRLPAGRGGAGAGPGGAVSVATGAGARRSSSPAGPRPCGSRRTSCGRS